MSGMLIEVTLREIFGMRAAVLDAWTDAVFDDEPGAPKLCERLMDDFHVHVGFEFPLPKAKRRLEVDDLSLGVVAKSSSARWDVDGRRRHADPSRIM